jgi:AcrR family transcriptional regulator
MSRPANPALPQALTEAAVAVFAEHGLSIARVEDITKAAGTSKGAFYLHFASKEALYEAIGRQFLADLAECLTCYEKVFCLPMQPGFLTEAAECDAQLSEFLWENRQRLAMVLEGAAGTSCGFLSDAFLDLIERHTRDNMQRHEAMLPEASRGCMDIEFGSLLATGIVFMYARRMIRAKTKPDMVEPIAAFRRLIAVGVLQTAVDASWAHDPEREAT